MKQVSWTAGTGDRITITLTIERKLDNQGRRTRCEVEVVRRVAVNGEDIGLTTIGRISHPQAVAVINGAKTLGLTRESFSKYNFAMDTVRAEAAAINADFFAHEIAMDAVTAESERIAAIA